MLGATDGNFVQADTRGIVGLGGSDLVVRIADTNPVPGLRAEHLQLAVVAFHTVITVAVAQPDAKLPF